MNTTTTDRETLKRRIIELAGQRRTYGDRRGGGVPLSLEKYRFITRPDLLKAFATALPPLVPPDTDRLAGAELGAAPIVTALALETGLPFVIIRTSGPSGGIGAAIEGEHHPGERFTLVEDLLKTGDGVMEAIARIGGIGGRVIQCLAVVDRGRGAVRRVSDAGIPCHALVLIRDEESAR